MKKLQDSDDDATAAAALQELADGVFKEDQTDQEKLHDQKKPDSGAAAAGIYASSSSKINAIADQENYYLHKQIAALYGQESVPDFINMQKEIFSKLPTRSHHHNLKSLRPSPRESSVFKKAKQEEDLEPKTELDRSSECDPEQEDEDRPLLFQVEVPNSNRLPIPYELAADYFPSSSVAASPHREQTLQLTDRFVLHHTWEMTFISFDNEESYIIMRGWKEYVNHYNLKRLDTIRFYLPSPRLTANHYIIDHQRRPESEPLPAFTMSEFLDENFMFEVELTPWDVGFGRLVISEEQVRVHFPGFAIHRHNNHQEMVDMVKFTDHRDKDWFMLIVFTSYGNKHMIMDGWEEFVKKHEMVATDVIKFYKPDFFEHSKHFLIQCVKRKKDEINPGQPVQR